MTGRFALARWSAGDGESLEEDGGDESPHSNRSFNRPKTKMTIGMQACPNCGANLLVPILYGLPSMETLDLADQGGIAIGGCVVFEECPIWHCQQCGHEWGLADLDAPPVAYTDAIKAAFKTLKAVSWEERISKAGNAASQQFFAHVPLEAMIEGASAIVLAEEAGKLRLFFEIGGKHVMMESTGLEELIIRFFRLRASGAKAEQVSFDAEVAGLLQTFQVHIPSLSGKPSARIDLADFSKPSTSGIQKRPRVQLCPYCRQPLRTPLAKQCFACGADWHDAGGQ